MRKLIRGVLSVWLLAVLNIGAAEWIVEDGRPNAAIVVAEDAPRLVALAAEDLRDYVMKISGAKLPIVAEPNNAGPVNIFVGRSAYTDMLGVTAADLQHGAYLIKSGPKHLVLLGHDTAFTPPVPEIYARGTSDRERAQAAWTEMTRDRTDGVWGNPYGSMHRNYNAATDTWFYDQSGSMNAVYGFLRDLGVRWYLPGDVGEVVPKMSSLALPEIDRVVLPDFPVRRFFGPSYFVLSRDDLLWMRRLGLNQGYPVLGLGPQVHGMRNMMGRPEMFEAHPEYYALIAGRRWYDGDRGQACFSSAALKDEAVNYARAMFDLLDEPTVDLWPEDGLRMCECDQCAGLSPAEAVFGFVDRVAREVYKTHPDRMITCGRKPGLKILA
ncbi:MAG: DUF4838 domain-containing protein [Lentisphaerae bacterium]|nr:DUF4838 domain-containing protein [Lentisphaerota bacterium]